MTITKNNGRLSSTALTKVQGDLELAHNSAADYLAMHKAAASAGVTMSIALPAGAYRTLGTQADMHHNPGKYHMTPGISLAAVGETEHGEGTCADIVPARAVSWAEAHGAAYGFKRRAANDPNCFIHTGGIHSAVKTAAKAASKGMTSAKIKAVAWYLANHRYGASNARTNGVRGPVYWRGVQKWGRAAGLYGRTYIINGIPGARTKYVEGILAGRI